jgi:hypothetical protein
VPEDYQTVSPRTPLNSVGYAQGFEGKELSRCLQ